MLLAVAGEVNFKNIPTGGINVCSKDFITFFNSSSYQNRVLLRDALLSRPCDPTFVFDPCICRYPHISKLFIFLHVSALSAQVSLAYKSADKT